MRCFGAAERRSDGSGNRRRRGGNRTGKSRASRTVLLVSGIVLLLARPDLILSQIKYGETPGAAARKTLLLRDFKPRAMLDVETHPVQRARFPVIDVHSHLNDAMGINPNQIAPAKAIEIMDHCNIQKICILVMP